jgi:transposase-like protein
MLKDNRIIRTYSESFKLKVLSEIESGRYSKSESGQVYGISQGSIYRWIKRYSKFDLLNQRIRIETMEEKDQIKALKKEISQLKEALANKDVKLLVNEALLEVLRKELGYKSIDELKKKYGEKL